MTVMGTSEMGATGAHFIQGLEILCGNRCVRDVQVLSRWAMYNVREQYGGGAKF